MAEQLFQIGIKAIIPNAEGKLLVLQSIGRTLGDVRWDFPGGRMNEDETFEQTLARELKEEINHSYIGEPVHFKTVVSSISITAGEQQVGLVLMAYRVELEPDVEIKLNDYETDFKWVTPNEAAQLIKNKYPDEFLEAVALLEL